MNYKFKITGQYLERLDNNKIITSSKNYFIANFNFDSSWENIEPKTVNFEKDNETISVILSNNQCVIPWEVMTSAGDIKICVVGGNLIPTNKVIINVIGDEITQGLAPTVASPTVYEYVLSVAKKSEENNNTTASILNDYKANIETSESKISNIIDEFNTDTNIKINELNTNIINANNNINSQLNKCNEYANIASNSAKEATETLNQSYNSVLEKFFALNADSNIYESIFYNYDYNKSATGIKAQDNQGLICEPSTDTIKNRDDYENLPLFKHWDVNAYIDEKGIKHITAIEGEDNFDRYNSDVYVMYPTWYIKKTEYKNQWGIAVTGIPRKGFVPLACAINTDGSVNPYMLFAKYNMSSNFKSVSGQYIKRFIKNKTIYTDLQPAKGNQYTFTTGCDALFLQLLMMIKYATLNSQLIMTGCTSYDGIYSCILDDNVSVKLSTEDANKLFVNSCISLYDTNGSKKNPNIYTNATIESITDYDSKNSIIKLKDIVRADSYTDEYEPTNISISPLGWKTGMTDNVNGSDGSYVSNTTGKYPCKIGGIEYCAGFSETTSIVVQNLNIYDVYDCRLGTFNTLNGYSKISEISFASNGYITKESIDLTNGIMYPTETGGTSVTGFCDSAEKPSSTSSAIFYASIYASYGYGVNAGLWFISLGQNNNFDQNFICGRISVNGIRGELNESN